MKLKRFFDFSMSLIGIFFLSPFLVFSWLLASMDTGTNGIFIQQRIGQFGVPFSIYKFRTIHPKTGIISKFGNYLRKFKVDELPQLFNVLLGTMSFVGPRPDIAGYYDQLTGENRFVLQLKPGLTSRAALKYIQEDDLLQKQEFPLQYNDEVIFPDKVCMNLDYYYQRTFWGDVNILWKTIVHVFRVEK